MAYCDSGFYDDCKPNSYFSFIENEWVSIYRQPINYRCLSGDGAFWKEVTYDDGRRRYININAATTDLSSNRVRSTSAGLTYISCPTGMQNP